MRRLLVLGALALALPAHAAADDVPVQLTVRGGDLGLRVVGARPGRALIEVRDARGSGAGWTLTISGGASIRRVRFRCAAHSTCTLPRGAAAQGGRTRVVRAAPGTGMGTILVGVRYDGGVSRFDVR
jgi:hypothetical protein